MHSFCKQEFLTTAYFSGMPERFMVVVVQLVRTPDCGSGGRRFESGLPPQKNESSYRDVTAFFVYDSFRGFLF